MSLSEAAPSDLTLTATLALAAIALQAAQWRLRGKGVALVSLGKWLAAIAAVRIMDLRVLKGVWSVPMDILLGVFLWLAFRAVLHDLYADVYLTRIKRRPVNKIFLNLLSFVAALVLVGLGLRNVLNVDVGSILTSSAIITAVIGLSMQDTIGSLLSGLLIQTEKPFKNGDWIKVGDLEGQVAEITWRYTKLVTFSQNQVLIPNNAIVKERVVNLSEPIPLNNMSVSVPAPVNIPPVKVKSALEEVLRKSHLVAANPPPRVRVAEMDPDQITYRMVFFVEDFNDIVAARSEVLSSVWYEFKKQGIDIPIRRRQISGARGTAQPASGDVLKLVSGVGLFAGMQPEELELLVQCAAVRTFPPDAAIVQRGQTGTTMFILVSGQVAVRLEGRELSRLGPGDVVGEMALLTGEPRLADVIALEPVSCLEIDREAFRGVLEKNPVLVANVTRAFREREQERRDRTPTDIPESAQGLLERFRRIFW
ncbi:MAG: cyclic nucleotide-binding domain-containing protein [Acidobacteriota bacterium]